MQSDSFLTAVRRLPRIYWIVWLGSFVNRLGRFVLPFLALHLTQEGFSAQRIGTVITAFGAGTLVAAPAGGYAADHWGRRRATLLGMVACAAVLLLFPWVAHGLLATALLAFSLGFTGDFCRPGISAIVADVVVGKDRDLAFALLFWAVNLAFAISPIVAGVLASYNTTYLFIGDALAMGLFALIVAVGVPETRPSFVAGATSSSAAGPIGPAIACGPSRWPKSGQGLRDKFAQSPYADTRLLAFMVLATVVQGVFLQHMSSLPVVMSQKGIAPATYGKIMAINGFLIAVLQPFASHGFRHLHRTSVLLLGCLLVALGFAGQAFAASPAGFAMCVAVWTLGEIAFSPMAVAYVTALASKERMGAYQGAYQVTWGVGQIMAPWLGMTMLQRHGAASLWWGCSGLVVAAGVFFTLSLWVHQGHARKRLSEWAT